MIARNTQNKKTPKGIKQRVSEKSENSDSGKSKKFKSAEPTERGIT